MKTIIMLTCLLLYSVIARAQVDHRSYLDPVHDEVKAAVDAQFNGDYVVGVAVIDSILGNRNHIDYDEITDPYGTLSGCILFSANRIENEESGDSTMFGVFKNGSILWYSDPIIQGSWLGTFATADINTDGQVEVLTTWWFRESRGFWQWMWIFRWSGSSGSIINQIDPVDGNSVIQGIYFELIDADGDGIQEIRAALSMDTSVTYGWNGTQYGVWPGTPQINQRAFLPANRLTPTVACTISLEPSGLEYRYEWWNALQSVQAMSRIYMRSITAPCMLTGPQGWLTSVWPDSPVVGWNAVLNFADMVKPGQSKSGFGLLCSGLPTIVDYFVQGYRPPPMESSEDPEISTEEYRNDIFTNSVTGFTIGPRTPPPNEPFVSVALTDTLLSYTERSRAFNWITQQSIADKYTGLFTRVRIDLDEQDKSTAQLRLDTVLAAIAPDSSAGYLTTEACALLRFNTEYLKGVIPEDPLPIQLWYFSASVLQNTHVLLEWGTLSETNNFGFEVQKSESETGGFATIPGSFVPGQGTTTIPHEYSYTDENTNAGVWYYRLKQIDLDGTTHHTDPLSVQVPDTSAGTIIAEFTATVLINNTVLLEWMTLREVDNRGFEAEEAQSQPVSFTTIPESFVEGKGTTEEPVNYQYRDEETSPGTWYYRLKQIDIDKTEHYTEAVGVDIGEEQMEMESFTASALPQQGVLLRWSTVRETNNNRFQVQVSRESVRRFKPVPRAVIPGHGTTTTRHEYTYRDKRPAAGVWYYRLKQFNHEGCARYTLPVRVEVR